MPPSVSVAASCLGSSTGFWVSFGFFSGFFDSSTSPAGPCEEDASFCLSSLVAVVAREQGGADADEDDRDHGYRRDQERLRVRAAAARAAAVAALGRGLSVGRPAGVGLGGRVLRVRPVVLLRGLAVGLLGRVAVPALLLRHLLLAVLALADGTHLVVGRSGHARLRGGPG